MTFEEFVKEKKMKVTLREKILASPDKVYYTKVYQYFIDGNGFIRRCRRSALDTPDCVVEFVSG